MLFLKNLSAKSRHLQHRHTAWYSVNVEQIKPLLLWEKNSKPIISLKEYYIFKFLFPPWDLSRNLKHEHIQHGGQCKREKANVGERRGKDHRPFPCFLCWDCFVWAGTRKRDPWTSPDRASSPQQHPGKRVQVSTLQQPPLTPMFSRVFQATPTPQVRKC